MSVFDKLWKSLAGGSETARPIPASPPPHKAHAGAERRRLPRVKVLSSLEGYGVEVATKVTVREISLGGFSVESPVTFPNGSVQTFLFSIGDGTETMVRCECRHVESVGANGTVSCIAGFQFLPNQDESLQMIVNLYRELRRKFPDEA